VFQINAVLSDFFLRCVCVLTFVLPPSLHARARAHTHTFIVPQFFSVTSGIGYKQASVC